MNEFISNDTANKIALIFKALAKGENEIELSRQVLCENNDYDPYSLFKYLDSKNRNRINNEDIINYLSTNKIFISPQEADYIIMFYDEDFDGELSYLEFTNLIQSSNTLSQFKINYGINNNSKQLISPNINLSLRKVLEKELELTRRLVTMINEVSKKYDFNLHNVYDSLKSWTTICFDTIDKFLTKTMITHNNRDVRNIIKRLDLNRDGRVDLKELHYFFGFKEMYLMSTKNINTPNISISNSIEETKFVDYLKYIIQTEESIEDRKTDLALRHDFNIENSFRIFDYDNQGIITPQKLKQGLFKLEIYVSDTDINILMNKYDSQRQGQLAYGDLFDMLSPFEKDLRCMVENRKPTNEPFMLSTKIYLVNLLKDIIDFELKINALKSGFISLRKRLKEIFAMLDRNNHGYFDFKDWEDFLNKKKLCTNNIKGKCLGFIRFDKKRRGCVDYCDLLDELTPV